MHSLPTINPTQEPPIFICAYPLGRPHQPRCSSQDSTRLEMATGLIPEPSVFFFLQSSDSCRAAIGELRFPILLDRRTHLHTLLRLFPLSPDFRSPHAKISAPLCFSTLLFHLVDSHLGIDSMAIDKAGKPARTKPPAPGPGKQAKKFAEDAGISHLLDSARPSPTPRTKRSRNASSIQSKKHTSSSSRNSRSHNAKGTNSPRSRPTQRQSPRLKSRPPSSPASAKRPRPEKKLESKEPQKPNSPQQPQTRRRTRRERASPLLLPDEQHHSCYFARL